jgi:hypothetical protein
MLNWNWIDLFGQIFTNADDTNFPFNLPAVDFFGGVIEFIDFIIIESPSVDIFAPGIGVIDGGVVLGDIWFVSTEASLSVPEPGTAILMGLRLVGLALRRRI